jgi:hypothetical protein
MKARQERKMRFQVLTMTSMKMAVILNVAPCSLVDIERRFDGDYFLHHEGDDDGDSKHL